MSRTLWRSLAASAVLCLTSLPLAAAPEDEVRAAFDRFVAAQNAHDLAAVRELLLDAPDFLWITRGIAVWGRDAAAERFAALYQGTWRLEPEPAGLRITPLGDTAALLHVPVLFTIGAPGQPAQPTRFLMNQLLVRTASGWRVASILPIPAAP